MRILLKPVGPFKSGTSTWYTRFLEIASKLNEKMNEEVFTVCPEKHDIGILDEYILKEKYDKCIILLTLRNEIELYPSAFLQDMQDPNYNYCVSEDIDKLKTYSSEELYNFFKKFNWSKYENINYDVYFNYINKLFKTYVMPQEGKINVITNDNNNMALILYPYNLINKQDELISTFLTTFNKLDISVTAEIMNDIISDDNMKIVHYSSYDKWYKDLYKDIKEYVKNDNEFKEKYKNRNKFYE